GDLPGLVPGTVAQLRSDTAGFTDRKGRGTAAVQFQCLVGPGVGEQFGDLRECGPGCAGVASVRGDHVQAGAVLGEPDCGARRAGTVVDGHGVAVADQDVASAQDGPGFGAVRGEGVLDIDPVALGQCGDRLGRGAPGHKDLLVGADRPAAGDVGDPVDGAVGDHGLGDGSGGRVIGSPVLGSTAPVSHILGARLGPLRVDLGFTLGF